MTRSAILIALAGGLTWFATTAWAHPHPIDPQAVRAALTRLGQSGRLSDARWPQFSDVRDEVRLLYERAGWKPLWTEFSMPTTPAWAMIGVLEGAADLGLSPPDYDAADLRGRLRALAADEAPSPHEVAALDVALTVQALRIVSALHHGRIVPRNAHATLELPREPFDAAAVVDSLRRTARPQPLIDEIQPPFRHYRLLRDALARYRQLARDSGLVPLPRFGSPLKPGAAYAGASRLRRLLCAIGDLPDTVTDARPARSIQSPLSTRGDTIYDANLAAAVSRFQRRHGFTPNGVIGTMTERSLNQPFGERIRQIELSLERWRWLPRAFGAPPVLVNVPAFRLYAFRTHQDEEASLLAMNVQVGKAFEHTTPLFAAEMRYLVFRPYWEVTPTIARREIMPKARRDPNYLARERLELLLGSDVVPATLANIGRLGGEVRVRQRPGPGNALGDVKFIFPNPHNVYMHDTPSKSLFEKPRRDFSHGCIRLSRPLELAELLLRDHKAWTRERIQAAVAADRPTQVNLSRPVPVYILYGTAMAREDGQVLFYPDIYRYDLELDRLLQRGYPYPR